MSSSMYISFDQQATLLMELVNKYVRETKSDLVTPEHILYILLINKAIDAAELNVDTETAKAYIDKYLLMIPTSEIDVQASSYDLVKALEAANTSANGRPVSIINIIDGIRSVDCLASALLGGKSNQKQQDGSNVSELGGLPWVVNLTKKAEEGKFDKLVGRDKEIVSTIRVLSRKNKSNVIHVGEAGVGKTAIVEGLANRVVKGEVHESLLGYSVYQVDLAGMLAGCMYRGEFESRLKATFDLIKEDKMCIAYIDEIHMLVGAGANKDNPMDASNMLKQYLSRGEIRVIGSTTPEEYSKFIEKDKALKRRFSKINIAEPSLADSVEIIKGLSEGYQNYHGVIVAEDLAEQVVGLASKYFREKRLPDSAIDVLDEACADVKLSSRTLKALTPDDISATVSRMCGITITGDDMSMVRTLKEKLDKVIYGQDEALDKVFKSIKMSKAGLRDENKTIANLMFAGATGTGKTELCKRVAEYLSIPLVRFDMSEYSNETAVNKLIGASSGYVGYDEGGLLLNKIKQNPNCVLLLDEIEKADSHVYDTLLSIMDYGTCTDNKGNVVDFRNVLLVMTSNAGVDYREEKCIGFDKSSNKSYTDSRNRLKDSFKPEFINRLDACVVFNKLNDDSLLKIIAREMLVLNDKCKGKTVIALTPECEKYFIDKANKSEFGAREISRLIEAEIKYKLADVLVSENIPSALTADIVNKEGEDEVCLR